MNKSLHLLKGLEIYLDHCYARGESDRTIQSKRSNIGSFITWCKQQDLHHCDDIELNTLELYRAYIRDYIYPRWRCKLSQGTQRNRLTALRMFLRRLYYHDLIPTNPAEFFELPSAQRTLPKAVLTAKEAELILDHVLLYGTRGIRDRAILETFYATGVRRMELGRLQIPDVDLTSMTVRVIAGKGNKDRCIPMAERTAYWIERYLREVRPKLVPENSNSTLFITDRGLPYRPNQLSRLGKKYIHRAGVNKPGACHLWRHSAATLMLENGAGLRHIQELLGHASIATTQIYTHLSITQLKEVYAGTHPAAKT